MLMGAPLAPCVYGAFATSSEPIGGPAGPSSEAFPKTNDRRSALASVETSMSVNRSDGRLPVCGSTAHAEACDGATTGDGVGAAVTIGVGVALGVAVGVALGMVDGGLDGGALGAAWAQAAATKATTTAASSRRRGARSHAVLLVLGKVRS